MSDIEAIKARHEADKEFFSLEGRLPWEQDDCILAITDIATLLSALSASEARAEAAEEALNEVSRFTPEMAESLANWIDKKSPHDVAQSSLRRLAENLRKATRTLKGAPDGR